MTAVLTSQLLSGCTLPSSGPSFSAVTNDSVDTTSTTPVARYVVVDIDARVSALVDGATKETLVDHLGDRKPPPAAVIGVGDVISIAIWEAASGGLFSVASSAEASGGSRGIVLPEQVVGTSGTITVPFAGQVRAAGSTPLIMQERIVAALRDKASDPQVVVTIAKNVSRLVTVAGEVIAGNRVQLSPQGDRLLDVIAAAGGIGAPVYEMRVQLTRGPVTISVPLSNVISEPDENIPVWPRDTITLMRVPRNFTAFGALGNNAVVPFDRDIMTLDSAIGKAGGMLDFRSDPRGIFLLRLETAKLAVKLRPGYPLVPGQTTVPIIYRLDLRNAKGFFDAQSFTMRDKDILYVSNAPLASVQKFLSIIGSVTGPVFGGASIYSLTK